MARMTKKEYALFSNKLGIQFEHWTQKLMTELGFSEVHTTQPSEDYGIDVIGRLNYGGSFGIQCKHMMSSKKRVGYRAVEEANSGVTYYHLNCGIVFTNTSFTRQAREGASKNGILLWNRTTQMLLGKLAQAHLNIYSLLDYERMIIPFVKMLSQQKKKD